MSGIFMSVIFSAPDGTYA